jgi:hypothetical protein
MREREREREGEREGERERERENVTQGKIRESKAKKNKSDGKENAAIRSNRNLVVDYYKQITYRYVLPQVGRQMNSRKDKFESE